MSDLPNNGWSQPQVCGWCNEVTSAATLVCLHCQRPLDRAWTKPWLLAVEALKTGLRWSLVGLMVLAGMHLLVLCTPLLALCPIAFALAPKQGAAARWHQKQMETRARQRSLSES